MLLTATCTCYAVMFTFNRSSPGTPTLADFGITKETLDRLALLKVKVEPHRSVFMFGFEDLSLSTH